jgi:peptidoglycan/xylan/chitin deacetylase (PgdA/CDA1 family)
MNSINSLLRWLGPITRPVYGGAGVVLMFHRVAPKEERPRVGGHVILDVTPQTLEATIAYFLKHKYSAFSSDDVHEYLIGNRKLKQPFVLFSFDDGYLDNLTYAYPIFKKHNIPFTINVSACFPERTAVLWWYLLEDLVLAKQKVEFEYEGRTFDLVCATPEEKKQTFGRLRQMFKFANIEQRDALVKSILQTNNIDLTRKVDELALTWGQLQTLASDPLLTIGAHSVNHYVLSSLKDSEVEYEIAESKRILETKLNKPVAHFAYPFGSRREAGEREFQLAAKAGFKTALTTRTGSIFPEHGSNLMMLPRYDVCELESIPRDLGLVTSGALSMRKNRFRRVITT